MSTEDLLDDVWGSDSESQQNQISYDTRKLRENHNKRGFLDGVTHAKETNLQKGFDEGFPTGASLGFEVGKLVGLLQFLALKFGDKDESLSNCYKSIQDELRINKVLTKSQFDPDLQLKGEHPLLSKWKPIVKSQCDKYSVYTGF